MKNFPSNEKGYIAAMGSIIALILITVVILFMFTTHKKQQSSINAFKDDFINIKMNDRIALERISAIYHKDLLFDLNNPQLITGGIFKLDFKDINRSFKIQDVSRDFGVVPRPVSRDTLEKELSFSLMGNTELKIEAELTEYYENLIADHIDEGDGNYFVDVEFNNKPISPSDRKNEYQSDDGSYHRIVFPSDEIETGNYRVERTDPGIHSSYNVYSGESRVRMRVEYEEVNRLVKITDLHNGDEGKKYYLKIENNSSLNKTDQIRNDIAIYLLKKEDLDELMTNKK